MGKKIAILMGSLVGGGAERVISAISLYKNDPEMPILMLSDKVEYPYCGKKIILPDQFGSADKPVMRAINKRFFKLLKALNIGWAITQSQRISFLKKFKKDNKIDVTLSLFNKPNILNILSGKNSKSALSIRSFMDVAHSGEIDANSIPKKHVLKLNRRYYKRADFFIVISEIIRERLISDYNVAPGRINVIYNPLDVKGIAHMSAAILPQEHAPLFDGTVFISIGRLEKEKGYHHLIRAFSEVRKNVADAKLVFMGKGSLREILEKLATDMQIRDSVVFLDFQSNPYCYLKNSSVYVLSSYVEGFPNALTEAMACGVPVISADCLTGPREILAPGTSYRTREDALTDFSYEQYGVLCPVCDGVFRDADVPLTKNERTLAGAMISLAGDKERREDYSKKGLIRVQDFDVKKIVPEYISTLESV